MGHCTITVHVVGAHHNKQPNDIDAMAKDFVVALKAKGHSVTHAQLTHGAGEELHHHPHRNEAPKPKGPGEVYRNDD